MYKAMRRYVEVSIAMVNRPELSDIVFLCQDGVKVHASSKLLVAQSSYFRRLLRFDGPRYQPMPLITSSAMIIMMRFMYSEVSINDDIFELEFLGRVGSSSTSGGEEIFSKDSYKFLQLSWQLILEVVNAARIFEQDRLKNEILTSTRTCLPGGHDDYHTEDMLHQIARNLSAVCKYNKVWTDGSEADFAEDACLSMVKILTSNDLSPSTLFHLSEEAFHYYLVDSLSPDEEMIWGWTLNEYLRLRATLTWCAVQPAVIGVVSPENLDRTCLPGPDIALAFLDSSEGSRQQCPKRTFDFTSGRTTLVKNLSKKALKPLLDLVDFTCIHPELLLRVIDPLNILQPLELTTVLGLQAMRASRRLRKNARHRVPNVWQLLNPKGELCRKPTSDNMTLAVTIRRELQQVKVKAIAGIQMQSSGDCEWEIVATAHGLVGQLGIAGFEVGFYRLQPGEAFGQNQDPKACLSDDPQGSAMKICEDLESAELCHKPSNFTWKLEQGSQFKWNSPIKVKLNRVTRTCSFSYAGSYLTLRMNGVKDGLLYPAIHFEMRGPDNCLLRPHYDFLTVNIRTLGGFNHAAMYVDPELLTNSGV